MKLLSNITLLIIFYITLIGCREPSPNIILENSMYTIVKLDSVNYLVSPTTANSNISPYVLKLNDKVESLINKNYDK